MTLYYRTKILGTGLYYPQKIVTNDDLARSIDTSDQWITERTGIKKRRISSTKGGEFPTDMALNASLIALKNANLSPNDIDCIIFATFTPDYRLPSCATILQTKLGITNGCAAMDISAACSGFLYALNTANSFIQTGMMKKILIIGSEMLSREVDWSDRGVCILFGDGCGVAVVGRNEDPNDKSEILSTKLGADGTGREFLYQTYGGSVNPITPEIAASKERYLTMNGKEMFKVAVRTLTDISLAALNSAGLKGIEDIDWFVPHQANIRILEATANRLNINPNKVVINIEDYANTSAATIPTAFHQAVSDGRIKRGQLILLSAFGGGLTSASTVLRY
ncbi:MAG: ketoacyl-ACP synthase III [Oligoflexia bacterium]|nr:ketoacyl-ACP synthase III [Oligoflexia bacterium]